MHQVNPARCPTAPQHTRLSPPRQPPTAPQSASTATAHTNDAAFCRKHNHNQPSCRTSNQLTAAPTTVRQAHTLSMHGAGALNPCAHHVALLSTPPLLPESTTPHSASQLLCRNCGPAACSRLPVLLLGKVYSPGRHLGAGASSPQVHRAAPSISPQVRAQERHASAQRCMHLSPPPPPPPASAAIMPSQSSAHASHT